MTKVIAWALLCACLSFVAGCGGGDPEPEPEPDTHLPKPPCAASKACQ